MSLTFTQQDLDNLKEALVTGAEEVEIQGRRVKYRSQKELLEAIKMVESALDSSSSSTSSSNVVPTFTKGLKK